MTDAQLTAALANLGLDDSNYTAVALLPLIEVAWADGRIQRAERRLIRRVVQQYRMPVGEEWLDHWLTGRPSATTFLMARTVLFALLSRADASSDAPETLESLLDLCHRVAAAAGGLFGLMFTVTRSERACLEDMAKHLRLDPQLPEQVIQIWRAGGVAASSRDPRPPRFRRPNAAVSLSKAPTRLRLERPESGEPAQSTMTMPRFDSDE